MLLATEVPQSLRIGMICFWKVFCRNIAKKNSLLKDIVSQKNVQYLWACVGVTSHETNSISSGTLDCLNALRGFSLKTILSMVAVSHVFFFPVGGVHLWHPLIRCHTTCICRIMQVEIGGIVYYTNNMNTCACLMCIYVHIHACLRFFRYIMYIQGIYAYKLQCIQFHVPRLLRG